MIKASGSDTWPVGKVPNRFVLGVLRLVFGNVSDCLGRAVHHYVDSLFESQVLCMIGMLQTADDQSECARTQQRVLLIVISDPGHQSAVKSDHPQPTQHRLLNTISAVAVIWQS